MLRWPLLLLLAVLLPMQPAALPDGPTYTADGQIKYPTGYPEWVFLGTGLDMSYTADTTPDHSMFNSVFVNPGAYKVFKTSGHWPDGTVMVLENRGATGASSINKRGKTESSDVMGMEIHVKDSARVKGDGWAFYGFERPGDRNSSGRMIVMPSTSTATIRKMGSRTFFVQFYPNALEIAKEKNTLSAAFLKESAPAK